MRRFFVVTIATALAFGSLGLRAADAGTPPVNGRILYVVDTRACEGCHLTSVDPDGTDPLEYPVGSTARWSPDGSTIAAVTSTANNRIGTLLMDADGSNVTTFGLPGTRNAPCIDWSPDASTLLCEVWDDVHPHRLPGIFTASAIDGSGLTRLTTNTLGGHDIPQDFSPDGTRFVFLRENFRRAHRHLAVFVANADGSGIERITGWKNDTMCCQVRWSPDGSEIAYGAGGKLQTIHPDGTGRAVIPVDAGVHFQFAFAPAWSPDGTRLAFELYVSSTGTVDIFTAATDGSDTQAVTVTTRRFEGSPDWGTHPTV